MKFLESILKNRKDRLLLVKLFIIFLPLAAIGTLSHETGHLIAAQILGYKTTLHYASVSYTENNSYIKPSGVSEKTNTIICLAGPLQTTIAGTIGLIWLIRIRKKKKQNQALGNYGWIAVMLSLFWTREVFNLLTGYIPYLAGLKSQLYTGDEIKLALALELPEWVILVILGIIGIAVCLTVFLYLVPPNRKIHLLLGGGTGSVVGFTLWMYWLGPLLLP